MSKAYPSNLNRVQFEFLSNLIPEPKPGGRPREVNIPDFSQTGLKMSSKTDKM